VEAAQEIKTAIFASLAKGHPELKVTLGREREDCYATADVEFELNGETLRAAITCDGQELAMLESGRVLGTNDMLDAFGSYIDAVNDELQEWIADAYQRAM